MSMEQLMAMLGEETRSKPREPMTETQRAAVVMDLREIAERYNAPCPFKAGDLVTPRSDSNLKGVGEPHIVIEVASEPIRFLPSNEVHDIGSMHFGARLDIRTATKVDGTVVCHWGESFSFEPYGS